MTLRSITLMLPNELITQLQQLVTDSPDALHQFVIQAIEHELQRRQGVSRQQAFWAKVETIRAQMTTEGIEVNPDEIWGDVRDRSPGHEVVL
jgi:predicted transcriptional regulator